MMNSKKKAVQILIEQAFEKMKEKCRLREMSVVDLCKAANVSHASFYHYYEDIYDLNEKIEKEEFVHVLKSLNTKNHDGYYSDFIRLLISFVKKHIRLYKQDELYILFHNLEKLFADTFSVFNDTSLPYSGMNRYVFVSYIAIISQMAKDGEKSFSETNISYLMKIWEELIQFSMKQMYPSLSEKEISKVRSDTRKKFFENIDEMC